MKVEILIDDTVATTPPSIKLIADNVAEEATLSSIVQLSDAGTVPAESYILKSREINGTSTVSITLGKI